MREDITGGTSGMALATAKLFSEEGAYVFITGRRQEQLFKAVKEVGRNVTGVRADSSSLADLDRVFDTVKKEKGHLDILFASAVAVRSSWSLHPFVMAQVRAPVHSRRKIPERIAMKRVILWVTGILVVLIVAILLAFRLSPWPSVAIITYAFSKGDRASEAALEKYVASGIVSRRDIAYGGAKDEVFDLYYPQGASALPAIVWVHGGGFVAGSKQGIANYMKVLAGHRYTMIAVEYSKGYGTRYPKPVEQVNAALGFVFHHAVDLKVDPAMIVLAGDSAGAHISSQVALITTDRAYASGLGIEPQLKPHQLSAMLLLSGAYDPSAVDFKGNYAWFLKTVLWAYSGAKTFQDDERFKLMSVTTHVTREFPPTFISSGNADPLAPQALALAQRLESLGVYTETLFFPADRSPPLPHEYQFNLDEPAGQEALDRMLAFLKTIRETATTRPSPAAESP